MLFGKIIVGKTKIIKCHKLIYKFKWKFPDNSRKNEKYEKYLWF